MNTQQFTNENRRDEAPMKLWTPILYERQDSEVESLIHLATSLLQDAWQHWRQTGWPIPEVEVVFPDLCRIAFASGGTPPWSPIRFTSVNDFEAVEINRLATYVRQVFQNAPHMVRSLLSPVVPPIADAPHFSIKPATTSPVRVVDVVPQMPNAILPHAPAKLETKPSKPRRDPAYEVTQVLLSKVTIKILGEAIYSYTGTHYAHISAENLRRLIMAVCREEVSREGNARLIEEVYRLLLCEPMICEHTENINTNLLSFRNGILNLENGVLLPHDPRFNTYYMIQGNYAASGHHPVFDRFLDSVTSGDSTLQQRILEVIGYCLVPDTAGKSFFVFQGVPDSGKSVLAAFIRDCLNPEATVALDILTLGDRFAASSLIGKQLCVSMDLPASPLNSRSISTFKMVTGGDPITADVKYKSAVTFLNGAKFLLGTNHPLLTQHEDPAFYRRAVPVPFLNSIHKEHQDHELRQKLATERDAIVYSALQAYYALRARKYRFSGDFRLNDLLSQPALPSAPSVQLALQSFITEHFVPDPDGFIFVQPVHQQFCAEYGLMIQLQSFSTQFMDACAALAYQDVRKASKQRMTPGGNPQARIAGIRSKDNE